MYVAICGAFALGVGIERFWPASNYGGLPAGWWVGIGAIAVACGIIGQAERNRR